MLSGESRNDDRTGQILQYRQGLRIHRARRWRRQGRVRPCHGRSGSGSPRSQRRPAGQLRDRSRQARPEGRESEASLSFSSDTKRRRTETSGAVLLFGNPACWPLSHLDPGSCMRVSAGPMEAPMTRKLIAEFIGTFWLVLGGCGAAVLAAKVPGVGIGYLGVALAFGLTVVTAAYAFAHNSGAHFNPAITLGLWAGGRFPAGDIIPYWIAQVARSE